MASNQVAHISDISEDDPVLLQADSKRTNASVLSAPGPKNTERSQLGGDFQPSHSSIICGRGKQSYTHAGNHRFRMLANMFVKKYSHANRKKDKSAIVSDIVVMIRQSGGIFCKHEKGAWFEIGDHSAREKTSTLLRDLLHTQYRSSAKAKIDRRRTRNRNEKETQQDGHQVVDSTITGPSDDSSIASWPCCVSSQESLELGNKLEGKDDDDDDFFEMNVF
jgi:hypothetical protein